VVEARLASQNELPRGKPLPRGALVFAGLAFLTAIFILNGLHPGNTDNSNVKTQSNAKTQSISAPESVTPHNEETRKPVVEEMKISDYLLQSPSKLTKALGDLTNETECSDTDGIQREYAGGYACIQNGRVILISYDIKSAVTTPTQALAAVGLKPSVDPYEVMGVAYVWMSSRGNPITIRGLSATNVMVTLGQVPSVTVDLTGAHPVAQHRQIDPTQAATREYFQLYKSDFGGVFSRFSLENGTFSLYVSDQWKILPERTRELIIHSLGDRWNAVNGDFGGKIALKRVVLVSATGQALAEVSDF
jgi:hypothetical protein